MTTQTWRNRIVGHGEESPEQLLANPKNWRIHPKSQQDALAGVLREVGWVQEIVVNRRTGFVVDGHLRAAMAIGERQPSVPVKYVDLDEAEEALILATLDPLASLAATDAEQLAALLGEVSTGEAALQQMLSDLAERSGVLDAALAPEVAPAVDVPETYGVLVTCASEAEQATLLERFIAEGLRCRALLS